MRNETPFEHIQRSMMLFDSVYATKAEIMATSAMLDVDIYVSLKSHAYESVSWQRFSASIENSKETALYI